MYSGVDKLREKQPLMKMVPSSEKHLMELKGHFKINHKYERYGIVDRFFELHITIPRDRKGGLPTFYEVGGLIARVHDNHINSDGSLCLGVYPRLKEMLKECDFDIYKYTERTLIPFLYATSLRLEGKSEDWIFGESSHGIRGVLEYCHKELGTSNYHQALHLSYLGSLKKREANKQRCPCLCGKKFGDCDYFYINDIRKNKTREYFSNIFSSLLGDISLRKKEKKIIYSLLNSTTYSKYIRAEEKYVRKLLQKDILTKEDVKNGLYKISLKMK